MMMACKNSTKFLHVFLDLCDTNHISRTLSLHTGFKFHGVIKWLSDAPDCSCHFRTMSSRKRLPGNNSGRKNFMASH